MTPRLGLTFGEKHLGRSSFCRFLILEEGRRVPEDQHGISGPGTGRARRSHVGEESPAGWGMGKLSLPCSPWEDPSSAQSAVSSDPGQGLGEGGKVVCCCSHGGLPAGLRRDKSFG